MTTVGKGLATKMHHGESAEDKRRKKSADEKRESESPKTIILPQKKRVLPNSAASSPAKKNQKSITASSSPDEGIADENLIRETEAALKNLSGSWPGPRGSSYKRQQEESPAFENLFDEKKANVKLSPSSSSNCSSDNTCSLKDVITLREPHEETEDKTEILQGSKPIKIKQENEDSKGESNYYLMQQAKTKAKPPDFNELVDDSSNELEIDMSEAAADKNEASNDSERIKKDSDDIKPHRYPSETAPLTYHNFPRPVTTSASPFSSTSAFRPPQTTSKTAPLTSLGPYPAEATFVGYPGAMETSSNVPVEKSKNLIPIKTEDVPRDVPPCGSVEVKSPEAVNKHYTILQPAAVGSRAANALQEIAGVPPVSVVNSGSSPSSSSDTSVKMVAPSPAPGSLSPNSLSRGEFF